MARTRKTARLSVQGKAPRKKLGVPHPGPFAWEPDTPVGGSASYVPCNDADEAFIVSGADYYGASCNGTYQRVPGEIFNGRPVYRQIENPLWYFEYMLPALGHRSGPALNDHQKEVDSLEEAGRNYEGWVAKWESVRGKRCGYLRQMCLSSSSKKSLNAMHRLRRARFRGLIRAAVVFQRMRLRAALNVYAPGGAGFEAAKLNFRGAIGNSTVSGAMGTAATAEKEETIVAGPEISDRGATAETTLAMAAATAATDSFMTPVANKDHRSAVKHMLAAFESHYRMDPGAKDAVKAAMGKLGVQHPETLMAIASSMNPRYPKNSLPKPPHVDSPAFVESMGGYWEVFNDRDNSEGPTTGSCDWASCKTWRSMESNPPTFMIQKIRKKGEQEENSDDTDPAVFFQFSHYRKYDQSHEEEEEDGDGKGSDRRRPEWCSLRVTRVPPWRLGEALTAARTKHDALQARLEKLQLPVRFETNSAIRLRAEAHKSSASNSSSHRPSSSPSSPLAGSSLPQDAETPHYGYGSHSYEDLPLPPPWVTAVDDSHESYGTFRPLTIPLTVQGDATQNRPIAAATAAAAADDHSVPFPRPRKLQLEGGRPVYVGRFPYDASVSSWHRVSYDDKNGRWNVYDGDRSMQSPCGCNAVLPQEVPYWEHDDGHYASWGIHMRCSVSANTEETKRSQLEDNLSNNIKNIEKLKARLATMERQNDNFKRELKLMGDDGCTGTQSYKVVHYARANVVDGGRERLVRWMGAHGVEKCSSAASEAIYSVDVADVDLTRRHFRALQNDGVVANDRGESGGCSQGLQELRRCIQDGQLSPGWLEEDEDLTPFERGYQIGRKKSLTDFCHDAGVQVSGNETIADVVSDLQALLEEICDDSAGVAESTSIHEAIYGSYGS